MLQLETQTTAYIYKPVVLNSWIEKMKNLKKH